VNPKSRTTPRHTTLERSPALSLFAPRPQYRHRFSRRHSPVSPPPPFSLTSRPPPTQLHDRTDPPRAWPLSLYKTFVCFEAFVPSLHSSRPPALPTRLQYDCTTIAQYMTPPPTSLVYAIHHTILVMTISCEGQLAVSRPRHRRSQPVPSSPSRAQFLPRSTSMPLPPSVLCFRAK